MDDLEEPRDPVQVYILDGKGYVWDADGAYWLRKSCGIVGAMIGGVSAFKQQNAVHGLPLELCPEEVTLILQEKWGEPRRAVGCPNLAAVAAGNGTAGGTEKKRKWPGAYSDDDDDDDDYAYDQEERKPAPWQEALATGAQLEVPTTLEDVPKAEGKDMETSITSNSTAEWTYPSTMEERHRFIVFRDLHRQGFRITGGSKFGADFLLYPGDPTLYHAQFGVRIMPYGTRILPALLASACRGSFQARKHLLMASVVESNDKDKDPKVKYMTFGPVDGFG